MRFLKHLATAGALLLCGIAAGETAPAASVKVNIPAQSLSDALNVLAAQTGLQLIFNVEEVMPTEVIAPPVTGTFTPEAALKALLANTNLRYKFVDARTVALSVAQDTASRASRKARGSLRLTRAESDESRNMQKAAAAAEAGKDVSSDDAPVSKGVPEILVKGKRTFNTDIQRTEDDVQPYVVFDAKAIDRSMATNLEDFLKSRLPMNMVVGTNSQQAQLAGNTSTIDLRGLGPDETLILVNGRRMPGVSDIARSGSVGQPDINGIPLSAVERIEVLPSTASGIYGADAIGGVVNIVLKSDFNAFELGATYDNTFDTDSGTRRLDGVAGFSLEGGRTSVMLTGSYSDGNSLAVGDRDFVSRAYRLYVENTAEDFSSGFSPPLGSTANINLLFDLDGFDTLRLVDPNGGPPIVLDSAIIHVPIGYAGIESDGGAGLAAAAGSYNIELPRDVQGLGAGVINHPVVTSLVANVRREFTGRLEAFLDLNWTRNEGRYVHARDSFGYTLNPGDPSLPEGSRSPGNPFYGIVNISFPVPGLSFETLFASENKVANTGLIARLPREWIGQAEYSWARSRTEGSDTSPILNQAALADIASGAFDIFRDLNVFRPDYAGDGYLLESPNNFFGPFQNTRSGATARLAGPVHELPGGAVSLSAFYEYREDDIAAGTSRQGDAFGGVTRNYYADRSQEVNSFSLELNAPLFAPRNARPLLHAVDVQVSGRYDDYRINGVATSLTILGANDPIPDDLPRSSIERHSADYVAGLRYAPTQDVALRASFGTGFRPPSVAQIISTQRTASLFVTDPLRGDRFAVVPNVVQISGGSLTLEPEISESLSVGLILTPRALPGLRLSLDYTAIEKVNEIGGLFASTLLANPELFPGRLERGALTQQDINLGYTAGPITMIDLRLINSASTTIETCDVQLDYRFDTPAGEVRAYALATYLQDYVTRLLPSSPLVSHEGHNSRLKWRGNAGLTLERQNWSMDWNMQYFDSYLIYAGGLTPAAAQSQIIQQGNDGVIPSQIYHDLTARVRLADLQGGIMSGLLSNIELLLGIRNVFNTSPPITATASPAGGYSFLGDPRLRRYSVSLRKSFR